jgi:hypothetical protein
VQRHVQRWKAEHQAFKTALHGPWWTSGEPACWCEC